MPQGLGSDGSLSVAKAQRIAQSQEHSHIRQSPELGPAQGSGKAPRLTGAKAQCGPTTNTAAGWA